MSWNRGTRQLKGWDSRDIAGIHFSVFYDEGEQVRGVPEANLRAAFEYGRTVSEGWRVKRNGSIFRASVEIEFLRPADDQQPAFIKIVRDISHNYQERRRFV